MMSCLEKKLLIEEPKKTSDYIYDDLDSNKEILHKDNSTTLVI